jgi:hypothetical protein
MSPLRQALGLHEGFLAIRIFSVLRVSEAEDDSEWPLRIDQFDGTYLSLGSAYDAIDEAGMSGLSVGGMWLFLDLAEDADRRQLTQLAAREAPPVHAEAQ